MTPETPETAIINEMETPTELSQEEMQDSRYSYDLPQNDVGQGESKLGEDVSSPPSPSSESPEEDNLSEVPGDPRAPHQTQPPSAEQY